MLGARERRILDAFVDAMIPPGRRPGARATEVPARFERYIASLPVAPRRAIPLMLWAVELFPLGLGPIPKTFTLLSREERVRVLERLESHRVYPLRGAFLALKMFSFIFHCEDEALVAATGWGVENAR